MRTDVMAQDYLRRAEARVKDATAALRRGDHPEVIRYSQECVEISLKAVLRLVGIEYPKEHDVGDILEYNRDQFTQEFREKIPHLRKISERLSSLRGPSLYGIERLGKTPSQLFDEDEAEKALEEARVVMETCKKFYKKTLAANLENTQPRSHKTTTQRKNG
ncbi:MAG: HEPN domain-containing protein [Candidatus Geothermarchaeales archaeon]